MPVMAARALAARPLLRAVRWPALLASFAPALGVVAYVRSDEYGDAGEILVSLRLAALSLAVGLAFVLDDPSEEMTAPAPVSLLARRAVRIALTLPGALVWWLGLFAVARSASYVDVPLPAGPLLIEVAALAAAALGGSALGGRYLADRLGGPAGAAAAVLAAIAVSVLPWGRPLVVQIPGAPGYGSSWWWAMLWCGLVALVAGSTTPWRVRRPRRDPAAEGRAS
jgi:fluoroquinolone transport system permease protein